MKEYYDNILAVERGGHVVNGVSSRVANWYLDRGLAVEISPPQGYENFNNAIQFLDDKYEFYETQEDKEVIFLKNECVVCGGSENLTVHHVIPYCIKKYFLLDIKSHDHRWCVLLCEEHHRQAEVILDDVYRKELSNLWQELNKREIYLAKEGRKKILEDWAHYFIYKNSGHEGIKRLFKDAFLQMEPKFLPDTLLLTKEI